MNSETNRRWALRGLAFAAIACQLALLTGTAHATPLGLTSSFPDIYSQFILVDYDASGTYGHFTAVGEVWDYVGEDGVVHHAVDSGTFTIDMLVDKSDGSPISGSLSITGSTSTTSPTYSTPLLTSSYIKKFGFEDSGGDIFEWMFTPDGGSMATLFPFAGVILHGEGTGFTGSWETSFTNGFEFGGDFFGNGFSDTFAIVPEPSTGLLLLGALGIAAIGRRVYRRRRASSTSESPPAAATASG